MKEIFESLLGRIESATEPCDVVEVLDEVKHLQRGRRLTKSEAAKLSDEADSRIDDLEKEQNTNARRQEMFDEEQEMSQLELDTAAYAASQMAFVPNLETSQPVTVRGSMSKLLREHRKGYVTTKDTDGVKHVDCGDEVAAQLREMGTPEIQKWCAELCGGTALDWAERYGHLNAGQVRMNLGNMIRAAIKKARALPAAS